MWAHTLTVQDYQDLIDRGWRRSGKYCYKPTMTESCCPAYTVRCRVADFKASRSQRKVLRRAAAYMRTGHIPDKASLHLQQSDGTHETVPVCKPTYQGNAVHLGAHPGLIVRPSIGNCFQGDITSKDGDSDVHMISKDVQTAKKVPKPGVGADESKPHCQKAKLLRLEKWKKKQALKGAGEQVICKADSGNQAKLIEELLGDIEENPAHRLEISLVRSQPRSRRFDATFDESYAVYQKYQIEIHNDPAEKPSRSQFMHFLVDSPLQIRLVRSRPASSDFRSSFAESHALYKRYQMTVHNDDADECDAESFSRFLIESPLQHVYKSDGCPDGYGSFHQHYLLDGKIIAVGVIDILPRCVSSVYLYYDPEYSFLSLGTYSALRELAFTRHLHSIDLNIEYYYMGYYIHSCPKMKYKGQYKPSYLLCPETYTWHALECCTPKLDATGYSRFADQSTRDTNDSTDIRKVKTLHRGQAIPYYVYQHLKPTQARKEEESVEEYAHLVGNKGTNSLLLYRA